MKSTLFVFGVAIGLSVTGLVRGANLASGSAVGASSLSAGGHSAGPVLSADGRRLFFWSDAANLVTNVPVRYSPQLFVHDFVTSNTTLVSPLSNLYSDEDTRTVSFYPQWTFYPHEDVTTFSISSNGQFIAFVRKANHLVPGDTNFASDVFVHDVASGVTELISKRFSQFLNVPDPSFTNPVVANPMISSDGRWVFFESRASNLVILLYENLIVDVLDENLAVDVFRRDRQSNRTDLVTWSTPTLFESPRTPNAASRLAAITPDGQRAAFVSSATDLVLGVSNSLGDVYVRDMASNVTFHASSSLTNYPLGYSCTNVALSENGRFVVFVATPYASEPVLYFRDLEAAAPIAIATNVSDQSTPQISADGRYVLFQVETNVFRLDTSSGSNELINVTVAGAPSSGVARDAVMAPDGERIVFNSDAPDLTTNGAAGFHLYVRDIPTGTTRLIALATNGQPSTGHLVPGLFSFTRDLARIAFDSTAADLVVGDENRDSDVFVQDLTTETTTLVSRRLENRPRASGMAHAFVTADSVSADGRFVAFYSYDNDLLPGDTNGRPDVFIRDLSSGEVVTAGFSNNAATAPAISGNGRYVAYLRRSPSHAGETTGGAVFRFDRQTGSNELVSSNSSSIRPVISGDGNLIAFLSGGQLVLRNMGEGSNYIVGAAQSAGGRDATFTPDGTYLLFNSTNNTVFGERNLFGWHTGQKQVSLLSQDIGITGSCAVSGNSRFVVFNGSEFGLHKRDLIIGTNQLVRAVFNYRPIYQPGVSHDGTFIAYVSESGIPSEMRLVNTISDEEVVLATVPGLGHFTSPIVSADGRFVVYGRGTPLPNETYKFQILARDRLFARNIRISASLSGTNSNAAASMAALSADGRTVVFHSIASDLLPGDYNDKSDVFVFKLGGGDSDGDGLDDDWEAAYFGNLSRDGAADFDGDGANDRNEFLAATDPINTGSVFRVMTLASLNTGSKKLIWSGNPARNYRVEYKDNLNLPTWNTLQAGLPQWQGSTASVIDHGPQTAQRFYRVVLLP